MDDLIERIAEKHETSAELLSRLLEYEKSKVHLNKRRGAKDEIRRMITKHSERSSK